MNNLRKKVINLKTFVDNQELNSQKFCLSVISMKKANQSSFQKIDPPPHSEGYISAYMVVCFTIFDRNLALPKANLGS